MRIFYACFLECFFWVDSMSGESVPTFDSCSIETNFAGVLSNGLTRSQCRWIGEAFQDGCWNEDSVFFCLAHATSTSLRANATAAVFLRVFWSPWMRSPVVCHQSWCCTLSQTHFRSVVGSIWESRWGIRPFRSVSPD